MKRIALLLPERFFASSVTGILDLFYLANSLGGSLFSWRLLSADGQGATASNGLPFPADGHYDEADNADVILLPGVAYGDMPAFEKRLASHAPLTARLRAWHREGRPIGANCTGVVLLAESGLLDDRPAAISWWLGHWFQRRYPKVRLQAQALLTEADDLLCSGATTAYLNLGLRLVERYAGSDLALQCARLLLVDLHRTSQAPYTTLQQYAGHNDPLVTHGQEWLQTHLAEPFRLDAMAAALGTSERTLMRRFRLALSDTPLHYLQQMRLFTARRLLETSPLSLDQIIAKVGYTDVSTFRRLFKRELQCSPGEYRRRFAP